LPEPLENHKNDIRFSAIRDMRRFPDAWILRIRTHVSSAPSSLPFGAVDVQPLGWFYPPTQKWVQEDAIQVNKKADWDDR